MQLYFRELGEGQPLVILHGLFGSCDNWLTVSKSLAEKFKVYLIDQRNHGRSEHDPIHDYDAMAKDLLAFFAYFSEHIVDERTTSNKHKFCIAITNRAFF